MALGNQPMTPCAVMFDVLKRVGHMNHAELAGIVLSSAPLPDGRSAVAHAADRSWLSRFVVHAAPDAVQERLFADFGSSAARLSMRLRSRRSRPMTYAGIFAMAVDDEARSMDAALDAVGSDARPYRNLLERVAANPGYTDAERAELALVLFVAAGCTASASAAVRYALAYERRAFGEVSPTPASSALAGAGSASEKDVALCLGLVRICDGYVVGQPHWVDPVGPGCVMGSLAPGAADVCDVEKDVSSRHLRIWHEDGAWWASDLGSANGSWLRAAGDAGERHLEPGCRQPLVPGDELRLGALTRFVLIEGLPA